MKSFFYSNFCSTHIDLLPSNPCSGLVAPIPQTPPAGKETCPFPNPLGVQLSSKAGHESPLGSA